MGKGKAKKVAKANVEPEPEVERTLRERVDTILAEFEDAWLQQEDGWIYVGPYDRTGAGACPKKLIMVGYKLKKEGWHAAKWFWCMGTRKAQIKQWVEQAEMVGAIEVIVRVADVTWEDV